MESDFKAACYAIMTPKEELIQIMKQGDQDAPNLEPNPFRPNETPHERKRSHYRTLVSARHKKQRNGYMDEYRTL